MSGTQELAKLEPVGMAAIEKTPALVQQAYDAIKEGVLPPEVGDPAVTARLILQRIQDGTFDESLEPTQSLPSLRDFEGEPRLYLGFHFNPSTFESQNDGPSSSVYAVVEHADPATGEKEVSQFGGVNVLMQLVKAWEEDRFPFAATLEGRKTGQGYTTYWLRRPDTDTPADS